MTDTDQSPDGTAPPPLVVVSGSASDEEVAALTAVVAAIGAAEATAAPQPPSPVSQWAAPARLVRRSHATGRGGWRASALPR